MSAKGSFRKTARLTKDRCKALVASGLHRAVNSSGIDEVALAAGCCEQSVRNTLSLDSLPSLDLLLNAMDIEPTLLDEVLAAKGFRLAPLHSDAANDLTVAAGVSEISSAICRALADGQRDHNETVTIAKLIRPHLPALTAIVREADELRGAA
jgi:DNA-binding phage protein